MCQGAFHFRACGGAAAVCLVVLLVACGATGSPGTLRSVPVRASTQPEAARALEALVPLLRELGYPLSTSDPPEFLGDCKIGLLVSPRASVNAGILPGRRSPCVPFRLVLTEGMLGRLPIPQLRAVLAHELGHAHLGHFKTRHNRVETGGLENWWILGRAYDREEEDAADQFAVELLSRLEDRYSGSCVALALVLDVLAERGRPRPEWLSSHPSPERRAERTRTACSRPVSGDDRRG